MSEFQCAAAEAVSPLDNNSSVWKDRGRAKTRGCGNPATKQSISVGTSLGRAVRGNEQAMSDFKSSELEANHECQRYEFSRHLSTFLCFEIMMSKTIVGCELKSLL